MDFFSNIIKTTVNKVENFSKSNLIHTNNSDNDKTDDKTSVDVNDDKHSDHNSKPNLDKELSSDQIRRSSSGDTSGPDEEPDMNENLESRDLENVDNKNANNKSLTTEDVSHKALESAKHFGNWMYNVANKAGQTVTATAKQIKHSVEQAGIMVEFTKEQQEFIKEHGGNIETGEPPWVGCDEEDKVKSEVLLLSQDKRNFVRSPPSGVQFAFDMESSYPVALALLKEDPNLSKMRFAIVPKLVNEESFWRNYFYRVSLIKQSTQLSSFSNKADGSWSSSRSSSAEGPDEPNDQSPTGMEPEFISDAYQTSQMSAEEVRNGMRQLGVSSDKKAADDLEEELSRDLQEFEVVGGDAVNIDEAELERELAEMEISVK